VVQAFLVHVEVVALLGVWVNMGYHVLARRRQIVVIHAAVLCVWKMVAAIGLMIRQHLHRHHVIPGQLLAGSVRGVHEVVPMAATLGLKLAQHHHQ
jgi:hypothetical protein